MTIEEMKDRLDSLYGELLFGDDEQFEGMSPLAELEVGSAFEFLKLASYALAKAELIQARETNNQQRSEVQR